MGAHPDKAPKQIQRWAESDTATARPKNIRKGGGHLKRPSEAGARLCTQEDCCPVLLLRCVQNGHRLATQDKLTTALLPSSPH